jgi:hypothetical protein
MRRSHIFLASCFRRLIPKAACANAKKRGSLFVARFGNVKQRLTPSLPALGKF